MLNIVNVVGSGDLGREVDIRVLEDEFNGDQAEVNEDMNALLLRFADVSGMIILYRSGKYIIRGGGSHETFHATNKLFLHRIADFGIISNPDSYSASIKNIVYRADLGTGVSLEKLTIQIGLEKTEFEPEQFPGLVYRPKDLNCVLLVFSTGKVIITGTADEAEATAGYNLLKQNLESIN